MLDGLVRIAGCAQDIAEVIDDGAGARMPGAVVLFVDVEGPFELLAGGVFAGGVAGLEEALGEVVDDGGDFGIVGAVGGLVDLKRLFGSLRGQSLCEIAVGYGYASGQEAMAHFGLGKLESCDLEVILPHGKGRLTQKGVKANQLLRLTP